MSEKDFCKECPQRNNCRDAYEKMGSFRGPSILLKVIIAFLLPLIVFIVTLAALEHVLAKTVSDEKFRTFLSFLAAVIVTLVYALIAAKLTKRTACKEEKKYDSNNPEEV